MNEIDLRHASHDEAARSLKSSGRQVRLAVQYKPEEYNRYEARYVCIIYPDKIKVGDAYCWNSSGFQMPSKKCFRFIIGHSKSEQFGILGPTLSIFTDIFTYFFSTQRLYMSVDYPVIRNF